ncbi:ankyrin repeat-containing domain protein [Podospora didyma]|uniref:Ankyrin repeat-containing domain protein n=1 Tax=Podospora didyma TaxID=330526 RepID=A0AAE0U242_9PEZI|nr:ankyrin repeat-containing domain protein [Podospora didyma]
MTPLMLPANNGHDRLVHMLASQGVDIHQWSNATGFDALCLACAKGLMLCVTYLLGTWADINGVEKRCITPLHVAAKGGHVEMVMRLLRMGEDKTKSSKEQFQSMEITRASAEVVRTAGFVEEWAWGENCAAIGWRTDKQRKELALHDIIDRVVELRQDKVEETLTSLRIDGKPQRVFDPEVLKLKRHFRRLDLLKQDANPVDESDTLPDTETDTEEDPEMGMVWSGRFSWASTLDHLAQT